MNLYFCKLDCTRNNGSGAIIREQRDISTYAETEAEARSKAIDAAFKVYGTFKASVLDIKTDAEPRISDTIKYAD